MKNTPGRKKILYIFYLFVSTVILLEVALRIYNPFHFRVKGEHIVLEANKKYVIDNSRIPALERTIVHTKNSLGFRGPEKPPDFPGRLTVVTVGGSTTECAYLADGKTWTDVLSFHLQDSFPGIWVNNAGLQGHSTFGHIALIKGHIRSLKPDYVLILAGINDVKRDDLTDSDKSNMTKHYKSFLTFLSRNSELCNVLVNLIRTRNAKRRNLADMYLDLPARKADTIFFTDRQISLRLLNEARWTLLYRQRLETVIDLCLQYGIKPVLLTQPALPGKGFDPVTGVTLESIRINDKENGRLWWLILEEYNKVTRDISIKYNAPLIDLALLVPKSSAYFYDLVHFTNDGADTVGKIVSDSMIPILRP